MAGTQEKIELLKKIAHRFNEARIEWALGASMMLFLKGIAPEFHDIDLMVSVRDAECAKAILSEMGELLPPGPKPDPMYQTKSFMEFLIDSIEVDAMAGFGILRDGRFFDCSLKQEQIAETILLGAESIPLQSPLLWCKYYRLMGRSEKADMIERALLS
jgi:hypothetical protein